MQEREEMQFESLSREDSLEKEMATHSSILSWRIPRTEQPSGLQSIGPQRVRHDWSDLACMHTGSVSKKEFIQFDHFISLHDHVDSVWYWWVNVGSSVVTNVEYSTLVGCGGRRYAVVWMCCPKFLCWNHHRHGEVLRGGAFAYVKRLGQWGSACEIKFLTRETPG